MVPADRRARTTPDISSNAAIALAAYIRAGPRPMQTTTPQRFVQFLFRRAEFYKSLHVVAGAGIASRRNAERQRHQLFCLGRQGTVCHRGSAQASETLHHFRSAGSQGRQAG